MNFDIDELEKQLNESEISKEIDEKNKLKNKLNTDKNNYYNVNKAYKEYNVTIFKILIVRILLW